MVEWPEMKKLNREVVIEQREVVIKTREAVRALCPDETWLEVVYDEVQFMFCADDVALAGNTTHLVQGWAFRRGSEEWERVLLVQLNLVGVVALSVDADAGLFVARGAQDGEFKDVAVCTLNLNAVKGDYPYPRFVAPGG